MDQTSVAVVMLLLMFAAIGAGVHIAFAFGIASFFGNVLLFGGAQGDFADGLDVALRGTGSVAYEYLRSEAFATIPLFILLGDMINRSGVAKDLYNVLNRVLRVVPGRLAVATVAGNTVFAAVTGVSIAAAAAFSRIAYPQMRRQGYKRSFALGSIAGSACLGMLIPPSVLLIVWGIITEKSISKLFLAGAIPGLLLASLFVIYIVSIAMLRPKLVPRESGDDDIEASSLSEVIGCLGIGALILLVLGGLWGGLFTPTEAAGVGAIGAIALAAIKGMRLRALAGAVLDAGKNAAPIMLLLLTAAMYAKFLASAGVADLIQTTFADLRLGSIGTILLMVLVWLLMGMVLDSISIILLTVPIFAPLAESIGFDSIAFGIFGILAIEAGLLTPPFGLLVFTVKACVDDPEATLGDIFRGSVPYWFLMLIVMLLIWIYPGIATWLPSIV